MDSIKITNNDTYIKLSIDDFSIFFNKKTEEVDVTKVYDTGASEIDYFDKAGYLKKSDTQTSRGNKIITFLKNGEILKKERYDKNNNYDSTEYADNKKLKSIFVINHVNTVKTDTDITFTLFKKDEYDRDYIYKNYSLNLDKLYCTVISDNIEKTYDKYGNIREHTNINILNNEKRKICYFKDNLSVEILEDSRGISNLKILTRNYKAEKITEEQLKNILINDERITEGQWKNWKIREEKNKEGLQKDKIVERVEYNVDVSR